MSVSLRGGGAQARPVTRGVVGVAVLVSALSGRAGFAPAAAGAEETAAPPALQAKPSESTAGYSPDKGFFLASQDGETRLRVGLDAIYKFEPRIRNGDWQNREAIYAARPFLGGTVFRRWIRFLTEAELAQNPPYLLYSYLEVRPCTEVGVRIGQQDTLISRHENFGVMRTLLPETDVVAEYFWTGRDKGITVFGALADERVDYYAGVYGGSPLRQFTTLAGNYVLEGRATINPRGRMPDSEFAYALAAAPPPWRISFTVQGYYGKVQDATENFNANTFNFVPMASGVTDRRGAAGVDAWLLAGPVSAFSEAYWRRTDPAGGSGYTSIGAWGQVGVRLLPRHLDAAVRVSWANPSTDLAGDRLLAGEAQVAWYAAAPMVIVKLRYGIGDQESPGSAALGDVALPATVGRTQVATLQVNLALLARELARRIDHDVRHVGAGVARLVPGASALLVGDVADHDRAA